MFLDDVAARLIYTTTKVEGKKSKESRTKGGVQPLTYIRAVFHDK